jgi:hypothetical protein
VNLAIYLTRRSQLKVLAPIATAIQKSEHTLIWRVEQAAVKSGSDVIRVQELEQRWPGGMLAYDADVTIGIGSVLPHDRSARYLAVDHFFDCWLTKASPHVTTCYHSAYHHITRSDLHGVPSSGYVVGWPNADEVQPAMVRDCVVFFSLKLKVPEIWRRSPEGQLAYRRLAEDAKARAYADRLAFVVKGRQKNGDPPWLKALGDEYYEDDHVAPYTAWRLLRRAAWSVHFESGALYESAVAGSYSVALSVPQSHIDALPGGSLQYGGHAEMHQWAGVSQYGLEGPKVIDPQARKAFIAKYLGTCDGRVGQRIVEVAEGLI